MYESTMIIGRLTRTPEMRFLGNGTPVTNFDVAVSTRRSSNGEPSGWKEVPGGKYYEKVKFYRISVWGSQAEACNEYLDKGDAVHVVGSLQGDVVDGIERPRIWYDQSGEAHADFQLRAFKVTFLDNRSSRSNKEATEGGEEEKPPLIF